MKQSHILHVDDDPNGVLLFEHACRKVGLSCQLHAVSDGEEAIAYLQGANHFADRERYPLPNLVVLDLKMPRLTGFDVLTWLRQKEKCHWLPVIVLSSSNHEADVRRAYSLGANSYLVKPVAFDTLVEIVNAIQQYWLKMNVQMEL